MPTFEPTARFWNDYRRLGRKQREAFARARKLLVASLSAGSFHPQLRIKRVQGYPGIWELTWAPDGRATFEYGDEVHPGDPHIIWRRVGTHDIFKKP